MEPRRVSPRQGPGAKGRSRRGAPWGVGAWGVGQARPWFRRWTESRAFWPLVAVAILGIVLACARAVTPTRTSPPAPPVELEEAARPAQHPVQEPAREAPRQPLAVPPVLDGATVGEPKPSTLTAPRLVRVGLATDLPRLAFPCCDGRMVARTPDSTVAVVAPLSVVPAPGGVGAVHFRLQVAALKSEEQAAGLAESLGRASGLPADVVFDAGTDLYRVRVGRFSRREEAEAEQRRMAQRNIQESWVVSESEGLRDPALQVSYGSETRRVAGRWLRIEGESGQGIRVDGGRYRGAILVFLNDRGGLNLINEVTLEDYIRGVVPREMGPGIYDRLDALKAQAVAARTYTLKNMHEFAGEGYDICATPRCQVYGGMDREDPLSDRAVAETEGEVLLHHGELVDAMYSSTCGGHTEDVSVVFPLKNEPYLKGVPCLEAGVDRYRGEPAGGLSLPRALSRRLLPPTSQTSTPASVAARFEHLALLAGLAIPEDHLASLERREVQRFIGSIFDLAIDARMFVSEADLEYLVDHPPATWSEGDLRLATYLQSSGLLTGAPEEALDEAAIEESLFHLASFLRVINEQRVRYVDLANGKMRVKRDQEEIDLTLPERRPLTYRRTGEVSRAVDLTLIAGDRLVLFTRGGEVQAIEQEVDLDGASFDRTSNLSTWQRHRTDSELRALVRQRYPDFVFRGLEIVSRGVSGRAAVMRLTGAGGEEIEVRGLPIRWTLDVPDTLFTVRRLTPPDGEAGWLFSGRGWGHGVGMCQVGAYGMALRGHSYRSILHHYYTNVELARVRFVDTAAGP
jgi:peptidoglycan hydrolase-like amidase